MTGRILKFGLGALVAGTMLCGALAPAEAQDTQNQIRTINQNETKLNP